MNGQPVIEGTYIVLPPSGFFVRAKAAFAIAAKLYPDDKGRRVEAAARLDATIYDALCAGQLVGRDTDLRLPIERRDLTGALMLSGCLISEADLNGWLAACGLGVEILVADAVTDHSAGLIDLVPVRTARDMTPGPERDAAMLAAHEKYRKQGVRDYLARVAKSFGVSTSTAKKCLRKARKNHAAEPTNRPAESITGGAAWIRQFTTLVSSEGTQQ